MTMEPYAGAAIKTAIETFIKIEQPGAVLVPRLVVYGPSKECGHYYNLKILNAGKETAYGVQVAVPLSSLANSSSLISTPPPWWKVRLLRPYHVLAWLGRFRPLNGLRRWAILRRVLLSEDIGLALAPGESVELDFGGALIDGSPELHKSMQWQVGQVTKVFLLWHTTMPSRLRLGWFKRHRVVLLGISSAGGSDICGHSYWKKA